MEWTQFIIFFIGVFGLFIWNRTEARSDIRHMDTKLESNRNLISAMHEETRGFNKAIHDEMKDFHYRMLEIEKNRK